MKTIRAHVLIHLITRIRPRLKIYASAFKGAKMRDGSALPLIEREEEALSYMFHLDLYLYRVGAIGIYSLRSSSADVHIAVATRVANSLLERGLVSLAELSSPQLGQVFLLTADGRQLGRRSDKPSGV